MSTDEVIELLARKERRIEIIPQASYNGLIQWYVKVWRDRWTKDEIKDCKVFAGPSDVTLAEALLKADSCF